MTKKKVSKATMYMAKFSFFLALFLFVLFQEPASAKKSYIVYLGENNHGPGVTSANLEEAHTQLLSSFVGSEQNARDSIFYSYKSNINGFAAVLDENQAAEIAKHPEVMSVMENKGRILHTTHTWDFLMMGKNGVVPPNSLFEKARYGQDTIIGNLDTGVWPESKSFSDNGIGPIPSKWKGICQFDDNGNKTNLCNKKLIGARYFNKGYASFVGHPLNSSYQTPRDFEGHGTHTLSTAAGSFVPGASIFGVGNGTAKGGSPKARAATYKVCWPKIKGNQCFDADIIKAFDAAINDGIDVLSVSLGGTIDDYLSDGIAIASFHAVKKGIVVVASAGNNGPRPGTVTNVAPWLITVAASTIDRSFRADVLLKNGQVLQGKSLSKPLPDQKMYPLISGARAQASNASVEDAKLCKAGTLDSNKVQGKIVVCLRGENGRTEKGIVASQAGAVGMILCNNEDNGNKLISDLHFLPASHISYKDGQTLLAYLNDTNKDPQGLITPPKAVLDVKPAPVMAAFSSRGPNILTPSILKPDVTAPGVDIIAAVSEAKSPSDIDTDQRRVPYNVMSGTSMSCPHVAGVAGLLKSLHPDWSPAAIRSAIMTTAKTRDNTLKPMLYSENKKGNPFDYGAGHIRPNQAMDPGLVYDLSVNDYLDFLCGFGYNQSSVARFTNSRYNCPKNYSLLDFNNPSITVPKISGSVTVSRKLKNVGAPGTYAARVRHPLGYVLSVEPNVLKFEKVGEEKVFKVTIKQRYQGVRQGYSFGVLVWGDDKKHFVRSPVVVGSGSNQ